MKRAKCLLVAGLLLLGMSAHAADVININTATAEVLAEVIKGVGLKRAEAIVAYRSQNGPFASIEELANVQGIGMKTVQGSRDSLTVADTNQ